jgi:hypothetical protein
MAAAVWKIMALDWASRRKGCVLQGDVQMREGETEKKVVTKDSEPTGQVKAE